MFNGEVRLSLCWTPGRNELEVVVVRARNLPSSDLNGFADPYVKLWLIKDGEKFCKQKTNVVRNCLDPEYNETFTFPIEAEKIERTQLLVVVMDYDRIGSNEVMGALKFGSRSSGATLKHWQAILEKPGEHIAEWHFLQKSA